MTRIKLDPELQASAKVTLVLESLPVNAQMRVLRFCLERAYERATGKTLPMPMPQPPAQSAEQERLRLELA